MSNDKDSKNASNGVVDKLLIILQQHAERVEKSKKDKEKLDKSS